MTIRLSMSSLAGTARTLVAVGTVRLVSMLVTVRAAAPFRALDESPSASGADTGAGAAGAGCAGAAGGGAAGAGSTRATGSVTGGAAAGAPSPLLGAVRA